VERVGRAVVREAKSVIALERMRVDETILKFG
jgi:hypothetical protein